MEPSDLTGEKSRIVEILNRRYGTTLTVEIIEIAVSHGFSTWEALWREAQPVTHGTH